MVLCPCALITAASITGCTRAPSTQPLRTPPAPIASPALSARSISSAATVAIHPLGLVPYDGMTLPLVAPDGARLATQLDDHAIAIYDLTRMPASALRTQTGVALARGADDAGFFIHRLQSDGSRTTARCFFDGTIADADHPRIDGRVVDRINRAPAGEIRSHALASVSRDESGAVLFFDPSASRMAVWMPDADGPMPLAPGSIAGCWLTPADGAGVLLTTNEGLLLQRIARTPGTSAPWRIEEPIRLLREPWVPRATRNPERPYLLIGPAAGSPDRPFMLQIAAMKLVNE